MKTMTNFAPNQSQQAYNVWAILGFVFAFIFPILGLIFSIIALQQLKRNPLMKGRKLAVVGTVISTIFTLLTALGLALIFKAHLRQYAPSPASDANVLSAVSDIQSYVELAYRVDGGYPPSSPKHELNVSIGVLVGPYPYARSLLFQPIGRCAANQDQYGYYAYKTLASKEPCNEGQVRDKKACQGYEIRFCLQEALGQFSVGDNVVSREGPPPTEP